MKSVALSGIKRNGRGSADSNTLRKEESVPCVIYGGKENIHFTVNEVSFNKIINSPEVYFVELTIDGTAYKTIVKDVQFHPVTDRVLHVDFLEVTDKPVTVNLPLNLTGNARGVLMGGKLRTVTRRLKVRGLADDLPENITIDIAKLKIGDSIKVGELAVNGLTFLDAPNAVVVAVKMSRAAMSGAGADEDDAEATEGEGGEEAEATAEAPAEPAAAE